MHLLTERLQLRHYRITDLSDFHALKSNPQVWTYSTHTPHKEILESEKTLNNILEKYNNGISDMCALTLRFTGEFIGEAGLISYNERCNRAVIGYNLLPRYWDCGYATEIVKGLVRYLFYEQMTERIEALVVKKNSKSINVLEKNGFIMEGCLRHFTYINNEYEDVLYYGLLRKDIAF